MESRSCAFLNSSAVTAFAYLVSAGVAEVAVVISCITSALVSSPSSSSFVRVSLPSLLVAVPLATCRLRKSTSWCNAAFLYFTVKLKFETMSSHRKDNDLGNFIVLMDLSVL